MTSRNSFGISAKIFAPNVHCVFVETKTCFLNESLLTVFVKCNYVVNPVGDTGDIFQISYADSVAQVQSAYPTNSEYVRYEYIRLISLLAALD